MPYAGHAMEHFSVCGVPFSRLSDYVVTAGFNHTSSHRKPIRPSSWVRISYVGNTIARLEMSRVRSRAARRNVIEGAARTGR